MVESAKVSEVVALTLRDGTSLSEVDVEVRGKSSDNLVLLTAVNESIMRRDKEEKGP